MVISSTGVLRRAAERLGTDDASHDDVGRRSATARAQIVLVAGAPAVAGAVAGDVRADFGANVSRADSCGTWTADYALAARLRLTDTPFGAGDGTYDIGPGFLRLRITPGAGSAGSNVELLSYAMQDRFTVESRVLFIHAKVTTRTDTRATPDEHGVAATGTLLGREITWSTPVKGYRTDGTIHCEGSGCGFSGVPPSGTSPLHIGPGPVRFGHVVFDSPDLETLHMDLTRVAHTEMPRQTAFVTFSGRRTARQCLDASATRRTF